MAMALRFNIPPLTRVLLLLLLGFSLVYQASTYRSGAGMGTANPSRSTLVPWISLTPQLSVYYPWVYLTAALAEQNLFALAVAALVMLYGGKYLERSWGSLELAKFLLVVTLVPNVVAAFLYVLLFALTRLDEHAYTSIQGSISVQAAFLVAFKQLVPEHTVTMLKGVIKIRVKHFPAMFLAANTISGVILYTYTAAILSWLGFLSGWTYLRFYKRQPDLSGSSTGATRLKGDASETFAFAYFWPDVVHGPIDLAADSIFNVLVALRICTPFSAEEVESGNNQRSARTESGLPTLANSGAARDGRGSKREEAERRRALALKALDQRLEAANARGNSVSPAAPVAGHVLAPAPPVEESGDTRLEAATV